MSRSKFYDKISKASIEREVEDIYNEGLALYEILRRESPRVSTVG